MILTGVSAMQTYGQFSVFPLVDQLPIWRDLSQGEPVAVANRRQKLNVVRREGDFYCIRMMGIGYGYVRAEDVVSEHDALKQQRAAEASIPYASRGVARVEGLPGDVHTGFAPVGFIERLFGYLIDFVVLFAIYYFIAVLLDVQRPGFHTQTIVVNGVERERYMFTYWAGSGLGIVVSLVAGITYWIGSWAVFSATPGKMLLGQRIVHAQTGEPIGIGASVLRYVGTIVSSLPLYLGYLWIIWDSEKQGWHDKIANTRVVRTR